METPHENPRPTPPRRHSARRLGFSGRAIRWVYLLTVAGLVIVLAAVARLLPTTALADWGFVSVGSLAVFNAAVAAGGVVLALCGGIRSAARRWPPLVLLLLLNFIACAIFPPHWLLARLQSDEVLFYVETQREEFALTIDDGIDPATTPRILDVLARHDARATFFVLGETLQSNDPLVRRLLAEGHELANHQWTLTPAISLQPDEFQTEVERANIAIASYVEPRWLRPGGGVVPDGAPALARGLKLRVALGSVFPFDSHIPWSRFLEAHVEGRTRAGSIVVLHDVGDRGARTAALLDRVLPRLKRRGLSAVTLSELTR